MIQQMLISVPSLRNQWIIFALSTPLTLLATYASWRWIEKPALRLKAKEFADYDPSLHHKLPPNRPTAATARDSW